MAGRYLPNPYHPPADKVKIQGRFGPKWAKVKTGKPPRKFRDWQRARQQNSANYILAKNWLLGFITGTGYVASLTNVCLKDATSERLIAWIDDYCRNNPREEIASAARMLFLELLQTEES